MASARWENGTTIFYASKFPGHITHVLEGAGSLQLSISRQRKSGTACSASDPTCFGDVRRLLSFNGLVGANSWHENMLRIMIGDIEKRVRFADPASFVSREDNASGNGLVCFEKVIVPGFYLSVFSQYGGHAAIPRDDQALRGTRLQTRRSARTRAKCSC